MSALVPYKRIDLAIEACRAAGARLRIVGDGPERRRLEGLAAPGIELLGSLSDEAIRSEYQRALALVLPGEEDFGIVPVEAQACGRPVVAYGRGGALETVVNGETGVLFDELTAPAIRQALDQVTRLQVDPARLRAHAEQFSRERHVTRMREVIQDTVAAPIGTRW